jgi:hypothetical protein
MNGNKCAYYYLALILSCFFLSLTLTFPIAFGQLDIVKKLSDNTFLDDNYLYSAETSPFGTAYSEWSKKWWQWYTSVPTTDNPNYLDKQQQEDTDWTVNQDSESPVFFLFQRNTDYPSISDGNNWTITIPKGKAIFTQIASGQYDYGDPQTNPTLNQNIRPEIDAELKKVKDSNNNAVVKVTLDGKLIFYIGVTDESKKMKYRTQTDFFDITLPEKNIWNENPGVYRALAEGYYIMLKPLQQGMHKLVYEVAVDANTNKFSQEMIYNLNVE